MVDKTLHHLLGAEVRGISLVVFDMAGTTICDDGTVEAAFRAAGERVGLFTDEARTGQVMDYVRRTMGESKIEVFRYLTGNDEEQAQRLNREFETAYAEQVEQHGCKEIPGARDSFRELRNAGVKVALTTGFSRVTADALIDGLGWRAEVDLSLTPAEAGRGRPYPDMPLTALMRLEIESVRDLAIVGDTSHDMLSGVRSGARVVAGVLTGAHDSCVLRDAGATCVVADVPRFTELLRGGSHLPPV